MAETKASLGNTASPRLIAERKERAVRFQTLNLQFRRARQVLGYDTTKAADVGEAAGVSASTAYQWSVHATPNLKALDKFEKEVKALRKRCIDEGKGSPDGRTSAEWREMSADVVALQRADRNMRAAVRARRDHENAARRVRYAQAKAVQEASQVRAVPQGAFA